MTVERLRNHAVAAVVRATTTRQNHDKRVQVCAVEILLVAAVKVLAVDLRNPRDFVQVFDLRAFGLEVHLAFGGAVGKTCKLTDGSAIATQCADEVPTGVVGFANHHVVQRRFHFHGFERLGGRVRTHDGNLHVRQSFLDRMDDLEVIQNTRGASAANNEFRTELLDAFERLRKVEFHGGAINELNFITVGFTNAGSIAQKHGPVKRTGLRNTRGSRFPTEHRVEGGI